MKWAEILGIIVTFGALTQFIAWALKTTQLQKTIGETTTFFLASIFSILLIVIIILAQTQKEIREIKAFLKKGNLEKT